MHHGEYCGKPKSIDADLWVHFQVDLDGPFSSAQKVAILLAVQGVANKLGQGSNGSADDAFRKAYGTNDKNLVFLKGTASNDYIVGGNCTGIASGGCNTGVTTDATGNLMLLINFSTLDYAALDSNRNNVVHELGHMLNAVRGDDLFNRSINDFVRSRSNILRPEEELPNGNLNYWQLNKLEKNYETFADMFVAWTFDAWNTAPQNTSLVNRARDTMTTNISEWINK